MFISRRDQRPANLLSWQLNLYMLKYLSNEEVSRLTVGHLIGLVPTVFYLALAYFIFLTGKGVKDKHLKLFGDVLAWVLIILSIITMIYGAYFALGFYLATTNG